MTIYGSKYMSRHTTIYGCRAAIYTSSVPDSWIHHPSITGPEPVSADSDMTQVQNQSKPGPTSLRVRLKWSRLIQVVSLVTFDGGLGALLLIHVGLLVAGEAG